MSNTMNNPHVYAEIEFIVQHNIVAGAAGCRTTTQQAIISGDFRHLLPLRPG